MLENVENYFDFEAKLFEAKLCVTDESAKKINYLSETAKSRQKSSCLIPRCYGWYVCERCSARHWCFFARTRCLPFELMAGKCRRLSPPPLPPPLPPPPPPPLNKFGKKIPVPEGQFLNLICECLREDPVKGNCPEVGYTERNADGDIYGVLSNWDTSEITDMSNDSRRTLNDRLWFTKVKLKNRSTRICPYGTRRA